MPRGAIGPGDDVEAWCTRCRMNLNHRVIAVVGRAIQRVHCLTCQGDHKYYPPKYDSAEKKETRAVRVKADEKARKPLGTKASDRASGEWSALVGDLAEGAEPRPYSVNDTYAAKELIEHPRFGTGRVMDIVGAEKMEVIFKEGRKVLLCNKAKASSN
jgi:hypothetical protein